jgi:hypothetical protein
MSNSIDRVAVKLTLNKDVELTCYPPVKEFFKLLTEYMSGEAQGTFGDVIISELTPEAEDVNKLWKPWYFIPANGYLLFPGSAPLPEGFVEIGRFKGADVPITKNGATLTAPTEFIIASWVGY